MKPLPSSVPDYQYPARYHSAWMAPVRWIGAAAFYSAYVAGRAARAGLGRLNLQKLECEPTLLIRTDGIGDAVLFEPALESLARVVSPSEVHLWAPKATCDLLRECPTLTKRIAVPRGGKAGNLAHFFSPLWRAKMGFLFGRYSFLNVVYPVESPEPMGNWIFASVSADERWINWGDLENQFEWQQAKAHDAATRVVENRPGNGHELNRNEYLADQWAEERNLRRPRLHVTSGASERAYKHLKGWRRAVDKMNAGDLVGVVINSAEKVKRYPIAQWAEAVKRLWDEHRAVAVILGGPADRDGMQALSDQLGQATPHFLLPKPLDLMTMTALIRRLDAMLSVDTGLAHIALSTRVPTVVLVGGGHPGRFFPWPGNNQHVVLNVPMPCDGCANRCSQDEPFCITRITPDDIVQAYRKLRVDGEQETSIERFRPAALVDGRRKVAG